MKLSNPLADRWHTLSITTKFSAIFGMVLVLILLMALTNYASLTLLRRQTEASIVASSEIQALVLEMDRGLQEARVLQRDFFLRYPSEGLSAAREAYALESVKKLSQVVDLSAELKQRLTGTEVGTALEQRRVDVNLYLSAAERFADTFLESVDLITQLAAAETGLEAQLAQNSSGLRDVFQSTGDSALIQLYNDLRAYEKDYLSNRQRPQMQSALNAVFQLRDTIQNTDVLTAEAKSLALTYLDDYESTAQDIVELDRAIESKLNDFDLQAQAVDPVSAQLIASATAEVERARTQIAQANQLATLILIGAAGAGLLLVTLAIRVINNSVTRNVVKLTETVGQWQAGDLGTSAHIDSADELGTLAQAFNAMARQLHDLIGSLEERVAERTHQLEAAAQVAREAVAIRNVGQLLDQTARLISERFDFYHAGIFLLDEAGEYAVLRAASSEGGQRMLARAHKLKVGQTGIVGYATGRGEPRIALDVGEDAAFFDNPDLPDTRSELALPLKAHERVIGALDVQSTEAEAFGEDDVAVLQVMADQLAIAIENARLLAQAQQALEAERRAYGEISREAWLQMARARGDWGYFCDEQDVFASAGDWQPEMAQAARDEQIVQTNDGAAPAVAIPLRVRDHVMGALGFYKAEKDEAWTEEEVSLLETLIEQLGLALESARLYQDTQQRAAREQMVGQVTTRIRETLDMETVLKTAAEEMRQALGLDKVLVRLAADQADGDSQ